MFSRRLWTGIICGVFLASTLLIPVYGSSVDTMKSQKRTLDQQIQEKKGALRAAKKEQKSIFDQLRSISDSIDKTDQELESIRGKKEITEKAIKTTEEELAAAEEKLDERTEILAERLREIYQQGEVNYLEVLLQATDFQDFLVRYHLLETIAEQDVQLVEEIAAQRKEIEDKQTKLENKYRELASLEKEAQANMEVLEQKKSEKQELMTALETEKETIEKGLAELERASNDIAAKIRAATARSGGYSGKTSGIFTWPTPGYSRITSQFGWRVHPILGTKKLHTGIDIGAPSGTGILSADAGVVIHAGWLGAYGNAVVVDHGGGVSTLYGHMSSIAVSSGQQVSAGQKLGKVGSTGWSTGPHLHFEVRVNGDPVSPWGYVK